MSKFKKSTTAIFFSVLLATGCSGNQTGSNTSPSREGEGEVQSQEEENKHLKVKESVKQLGNDGFTGLGELNLETGNDTVQIDERMIDGKLYIYVVTGKVINDLTNKYYLSITDGDKWLVKDKQIAEESYETSEWTYKDGVEPVGASMIATINEGSGDQKFDKTIYFINENGEIEKEGGIPYYDTGESVNGDRIIKTSQGLSLIKPSDKYYEAINLQTGSTVKINKTAETDNGFIEYINFEENVVLYNAPAPETTGLDEDVYLPYDFKKQEMIYDKNGQISYLPQPEEKDLAASIGDTYYLKWYTGLNNAEYPEQNDLHSYSLQNPINNYEVTLDLLPSHGELIAHQIDQTIRIYNVIQYKGVPSIQMTTLEK